MTFRFIRQATILGFAAMLLITQPACHSSKKAADAKAKAEREAQLAREREEQRKRDEADRLKREQEEKDKAKKEPYDKLNNYFKQIASNPAGADQTIAEAMKMFSSPEVPLLIIISKNGDQNDYDKPTTIQKYMEYLKDQKKQADAIDHLDFDQAGKIKEVTLIKKY